MILVEIGEPFLCRYLFDFHLNVEIMQANLDLDNEFQVRSE